MAMAALVLLGGLFTFVPATVAADQAGDFTYTVGGSPLGANVTGYTGAGGAVIIPATLGGYPVVAIGASAFNGATSITSLSMPDSVTIIQQQAFYLCGSMSSITLSKNLTAIGGWAFDHCSALTSITIPSKVTDMGDYMFQQCLGLTAVNFAGKVAPVNTTDEWFNGPTATRGHAYPDSNFPATGLKFHGLTMGSALATAPNAPGELVIMAGRGQAGLTWIAPSDGGSAIQNYKVYRSSSQTGSYSLLATPTATSYTDTGLGDGQTYWYKVTAVNAIGEGAASATTSVTTLNSDNTMVYLVVIIAIVAIAAVAIVYLMRRRNQ